MSFQGCGRCQCRCRRPRGLRRLDPEQAAAVQDNTLQRYRKAVLKFAAWLGENFPDIENAADFDEALVEYKQGHAVSKAELEAMVASLEFRFRISRAISARRGLSSRGGRLATILDTPCRWAEVLPVCSQCIWWRWPFRYWE